MDTSNKLDRNNIEDILALTPTQEGMLFYYINQPESEMYFEQLSLRLTGEVDAGNLKEAWKFVIDTNEMLRTVFRWENVEKPVQIVLKCFEPVIREYDFSYMDSGRKEEMLAALREADRKERLDIGSKPYRISLCVLGRSELEMVISNHHILYDGWSNMLILKELFHAYDRLCAGTIPERPVKSKFKEYIKWMQRLDKWKQEAFWKEYLDGFTEKTWLPYEEGPTGQPGAKNHLSRLPAETNWQIAALAGENQLTPAAVFYSAWGILLQKYGFKNDSLFGTTVSGRTPEIKGVEELVGLLINTIPLRVKGAAEETLMDVLRRADGDLKSRQEYEASPVTDIKNYIRFDRKQNLFDSILVIENYPLDKSLNQEGRRLKIQAYAMFEMTNYALTLGITCAEDIAINYIYDCSLFSEETVKELSRQYADIITAMITKPETRIGDIEIFSEEKKAVWERRQEAQKTQPDSEDETYEFTEPENEMEMKLSEIWKKVLGIDRIGTKDNFFDIGGNSLLLIQVHAKIEKIYPGVISGTDLFTYPTVTKLAQYIRRKMNPEGERVQLEAISLPDRYFLHGQAVADTGVIRFRLEWELAARIREAAARESSNVYVMLLAMFAYMFTELSGSKRVTVQAPAGLKDLALPLAIDLGEIDGFSMLFKTVESKLNRKEKTYAISEAAEEGRKKGENAVIPFFSRANAMDGHAGFNEIYDVIFEMQEEAEEVSFICQYNNQRLRKEKIKELVDGYCELIESLMEQYDS